MQIKNLKAVSKMPKILQDPAFLHIYAQKEWHDDVYIIGNQKGLETLCRVIKTALEKGMANSDDDKMSDGMVFAGDGEGYSIKVIRYRSNDDWPRLAVPYVDEVARENRWDALQPWDLEEGGDPDA